MEEEFTSIENGAVDRHGILGLPIITCRFDGWTDNLQEFEVTKAILFGTAHTTFMEIWLIGGF